MANYDAKVASKGVKKEHKYEKLYYIDATMMQKTLKIVTIVPKIILF